MLKSGLGIIANEITIDRILFDLYIYFGDSGVTDLNDGPKLPI